MRTTLLAAVTALAATAVQTPAEACGPYGPRAFLVSSHGVHTDGHWGRRTFVQTGGVVPAGTKWEALAPGTYDNSSIADAPDAEQPTTFTLVGPGGTRVVESRARWFLQPAWQGREGAAFEVDAKGTQAQIALAGRREQAKWIELDYASTTRADIAWLATQGAAATNPELVGANRVHGRDVETFSVYVDGKATTFVRQNGALIAQLDGSPIGAVSDRGMTYLMVSRDGRVYPEMI